MRILKLITLLIISLAHVASVPGQSFRFKQLSSELEWTLLGVDDIIQDHQGFIWIASWSGLARFDGYSIQMYDLEYGFTNGLKSSKITEIFEDSKNRLWVGANHGGFYQYDRANDTFISYVHNPADSNSLSNNNVWAIIEDDDGYLWIGTEKGLNQFHPESKRFVHFFPDENDEKSLGNAFVHSLGKSPVGEIWVGTAKGLNRIIDGPDGKSKHFYRYDLSPTDVSEDDYLMHNFIETICPSVFESNVLWLGTGIGLKKVHYSFENPEEYTYTTFLQDPSNPNGLSHQFVASILEEDSSRIWLATFHGLNLLNPQTQTFQHFHFDKNAPYSLNNNVVKSLFKDRTGVLWIGTEKGVNWVNLNEKLFENIRLSSGANANTNILTKMTRSQDRDGFWVSTHGGGMLHASFDQLGESSLSYYQLLPPKASAYAGFISDLQFDSQGWLWIATQGAGILTIKESSIPLTSASLTQFHQFTTENELSSDYVMSLLHTSAEGIWMGHWDSGLDRYDQESATFQSFSTTNDSSVDLTEFPIINMIETQWGDSAFIWLGNRGAGVMKMYYDTLSGELSLLKHFRYQKEQPNSLSSDFITCLYSDNPENIWIGTETGLNLLEVATGQITSFFKKDGMTNDNIMAVQKDADSTLWISTQQGISHLTFAEDTFNIKNYNLYDGIPANFFYESVGHKTPEGKIVFGGEKGLTFFRPDFISPDTIAPQIVLTDFRLANETVPIGSLPDGRTILSSHISETEEIELNYTDRVISFEFVGLQFNQPQKIQYAYRLIGFDSDWVYTQSNRRIAQYTSLPYDTYTFQVKAANGDGFWSEPVSVNMVIHPPFWLTNWAFFVYVLLFLAVLYGVRWITQMRADFKHKLQLERVEKDKMEEVNQMKLQFFTNISHELRTPLTLIISPLEQYISDQSIDRKFHRSFSRMYQNAQKLLSMINQLLDIRKSEAGLMKLQAAEGNMVPFMNEVMLSFRGLSRQREISLQFLPEVEEILVWFDRDQMEKVLFNLLTNAIKFTGKGGEILLKIGLASWEQQLNGKPSVLVEVKDTGIGISEDYLPRIFDRFYQVEKKQDSVRKGGTGIGLALSRSIVEAHHGKIWVDSKENEGTVVSFALPLGDSHLSEDEKIKEFSNGEAIEQYVVPVSYKKEEKHALHELFEKEFSEEDKARILIVEDNADIRNYLIDNLSPFFELEEAVDGQEGLEKAVESPPDLVLADISMPRMDGIELCEKLKSTLSTSHVPIILLTARTSLVFKIDGLQTGADDYVTKPFNMRLLASRVNNLIQSRRKLKERFQENMNLSPDEVAISPLDEKFLKKIKMTLEEKLSDPSFTVEDFAKALNMSRVQLYRKFNTLTGFSPYKMIRSFRLQRAGQLLKSNQYTVSEVTFMVGYNDLKSFREQFKKEFGVNPSDYKGA